MVATTRRRVALMGKIASWTEFAGAQLELVSRKGFVGFDVSQQEQIAVFRSLKRQVQEVTNRAMGAVATDDEGCGKLLRLAFLVQSYTHVIVMQDR